MKIKEIIEFKYPDFKKNKYYKIYLFSEDNIDPYELRECVKCQFPYKKVSISLYENVGGNKYRFNLLVTYLELEKISH